MEYWGIYIAYGWLATIVLAFTDACRPFGRGRSLSRIPRSDTSTTNEWEPVVRARWNPSRTEGPA